jgi:hypothetical protein
MATRRRKGKNYAKVPDVQNEFRILFEHLWRDPKYVALEARKARILKAWNYADAYKNRGPREAERARRLNTLADRVLKRLFAYEERTRQRLEREGVL